MKRFIYIILSLILITSCSNKDSDTEKDYKKEVLSKVDNPDEKEILNKIAHHKDKGVYKYITYNTDDNSVIQEMVKGIDDGIEFTIMDKSDYYFNDGKTITWANTNKNLYYIDSSNGINDDENDEINFYQELSEELSEIVTDDQFVLLKFNDGSYSKYDSKSFDLIEEAFEGNGKKLIQKLEDKQDDVKASYDKYIKVIDGMEKAGTVGEVTGNE